LNLQWQKIEVAAVGHFRKIKAPLKVNYLALRMIKYRRAYKDRTWISMSTLL